jgi:hypothetical protein
VNFAGTLTSGADTSVSAAMGDVILGGLVSARDVALQAGGLVSTQEIRAADDIAIRATGHRHHRCAHQRLCAGDG